MFRVLGGKVQASGFKGQSLCLGFEAVALRVSARRDLRFGVYVWICMGWGIPSFFSYSSKRWIILNRLCIHDSAGIYMTTSSGLLQLDPWPPIRWLVLSEFSEDDLHKLPTHVIEASPERRN